jgi:hypothetical protein
MNFQVLNVGVRDASEVVGREANVDEGVGRGRGSREAFVAEDLPSPRRMLRNRASKEISRSGMSVAVADARLVALVSSSQMMRKSLTRRWRQNHAKGVPLEPERRRSWQDRW